MDDPEDCQQGNMLREIMGLAVCLELLVEWSINQKLLATSMPGQSRWPGLVAEELCRATRLQFVDPVLELTLRVVNLILLPLPNRVVPILHRKGF